MKLKINFVTHNINKVREFKKIIEPEVFVSHINIEYPEIKADTSEEVALSSAVAISKNLNKPVVVEDSGLFIKGLRGFPGTCSAYIHRRIGLEGILKLMEGMKDRECVYRSAVAFCNPNKKPNLFSGEEKGTISESIKGKFGFGHDPIFIPEGSTITYGEMEDCIERKKFRRMAVIKLKEYLGKGQDDK